MPPPGEWLKPPRSLLLILGGVTLVAVSAIGWFGWRLLEQERLVEAQRAQERLEQAADRIAATTREALAETGERLSAWAVAPPSDGRSDDGVVIIVNGIRLSALPSHRLLYRPAPPPEAEVSDDTFSEAEVLEFQQKEFDRALESYRRLADSRSVRTRAGALMRIARVLRKIGRSDEARAAYIQLAAVDGARVAGVPAGLVARHALSELTNRKEEAEKLRQDLLAGHWELTRGQFEYYWSEASRLSGHEEPAPSEPDEFSEVVVRGWSVITGDQNPRGQSTIWIGDHPFFMIWRGVPSHRAILVTKPNSLLRSAFSAGDVSSAAVDSEGRLVAGRKYGTARAAVRTPAETQLPWTLYFTGVPGLQETGTAAGQRFLLLVTTIMALFLVMGAYFIARAVRRDLEISRMQSDFVSAVSHEFRSPLTSIRQLSEILALGRIASDERRQIYYETLVRESTRLQRLIEGLLNFGRMEAGVRRYCFEEMDAAALMAKVAAEFEMQIAGSGRRIELGGTEVQCRIDADPEALSVALRNLVDNALKYSPSCPTVWMECGMKKECVAISVRDNGPGIPASERKAIFRRFFRGSAAATGNVRGSGVGLAMVRHIVAAHGGDITLISEPGSGSTFTILLPAGQEKT